MKEREGDGFSYLLTMMDEVLDGLEEISKLSPCSSLLLFFLLLSFFPFILLSEWHIRIMRGREKESDVIREIHMGFDPTCLIPHNGHIIAQ